MSESIIEIEKIISNLNMEYFKPYEIVSTLKKILKLNEHENLSLLIEDLKLSKKIINEKTNHEKYNVKFQAIIANPPFSAKWSGDKSFLEDKRFKDYGKLAPKSKADYAFIQHMIYYLEETGTMAVVVPHGVLFRGAAEGVIRKYLIAEKNYLDGIIGLPSNLFYGTSIPTAILIFKKGRSKQDDVIFIDASKEFEKAKKQNNLKHEHIHKIVSSYNAREEIDKYCHKATLTEIEENDYNLNIPRYVDTFEEEEPIDLDEIIVDLKKIKEEEKKVDAEIKKYCNELGIQSPIF